MASSKGRLSDLQDDLLRAFFDRVPEGFFLTGGAALARFYLQHRDTEDLDIFGTPNVAIADGVRGLLEAAPAVGATLLRLAVPRE